MFKGRYSRDKIMKQKQSLPSKSLLSPGGLGVGVKCIHVTRLRGFTNTLQWKEEPLDPNHSLPSPFPMISLLLRLASSSSSRITQFIPRSMEVGNVHHL